MWGDEPMTPGVRQRMVRHWTFMHRGTSVQYQGARNPFPDDDVTVGEGRATYAANCASCHGATGMVDGDAGWALNPSPALLAYLIQTPMAIEEYMLWSVAEGGKQFGTGMPAFKDRLTRDQIWKIVTFMRAGFPADQDRQ